MKKVLFVCHGNICRSPIAEYVFKYKTKGMDCCCESRALSNEEIGNDIYPGSKKVLDKHHIPHDRHYAKRMTLDDYNDYDEIYLGYPNYCGTMPMAVYTFLEAYDFTGKTIHPFCTHEGSGLGKTEKHIAQTAKGANVASGLAIKGSDVDNAKEIIEGWV